MSIRRITSITAHAVRPMPSMKSRSWRAGDTAMVGMATFVMEGVLMVEVEVVLSRSFGGLSLIGSPHSAVGSQKVEDKISLERRP